MLLFWIAGKPAYALRSVHSALPRPDLHNGVGHDKQSQDEQDDAHDWCACIGDESTCGHTEREREGCVEEKAIAGWRLLCLIQWKSPLLYACVLLLAADRFASQDAISASNCATSSSAVGFGGCSLSEIHFFTGNELYPMLTELER